MTPESSSRGQSRLVVRSLLALFLVAAVLTPAHAVLSERLTWALQFGSQGSDGAFGVAVRGSEIYVSGRATHRIRGQTQVGGDDAFLRRYGPSGDVVWTRQYGTTGHDFGGGVSATPGGIYATGRTRGTFPGQTLAGLNDAFVRKFDAAGGDVWTRQFGTLGDEAGESVSAAESAIYVTGATGGTFTGETAAGGDDAFLAKYQDDGDQEWVRQFGSAEREFAGGVSATSTGIYVAGLTAGELPGETTLGGVDAFLRKYDADGNVVWTRQFGTTVRDQAGGVSATTTEVYVVGLTEGELPGATAAGDGLDGFVRKYDSDGNLQWTRQLGHVAVGAAADASGVRVTGWFDENETFDGETPLGNLDAFVVKYDPDGNLMWFRRFGTSMYDEGWAVAAGRTGVYVAGRTFGALPGQRRVGADDAYVARIVSYRPDALITADPDAGYVGDGVYDPTGAGQEAAVDAPAGTPAIFAIRAQNDGDAADTFTVRGCRSSGGFRVRYLAGEFGDTNITSRVVEGTYKLKVDPGLHKSLRVVITSRATVAGGSVKSCRVQVDSKRTPADAVIARVTVQ